MNNKFITISYSLLMPFILGLIIGSAPAQAGNGSTDNSPDWFYPEWAAAAKYNQPMTRRSDFLTSNR